MNAAVNKTAVAKSFSRAALHYDQVAHLQMAVGQILIAAIPTAARYQNALDIGCGTGALTRLLRSRCDNLVALDFAPGMLQFAREHHGDAIQDFVCADADALPFSAAMFDLVFSNFVLQWSADLPALLQSVFSILKPGGELRFSLPGTDSLWELKQSWQQADPAHVHVNQFHDETSVRTGLQAAGFEMTSLRQEEQIIYYDSPRELTRELKTLGAHTVNEGRNASLTGKRTLAAFLGAYEQLRVNRGLPATWNMILVTARKPR